MTRQNSIGTEKNTAYDRRRYAYLVRLLQGSRTVATMAKDTDLSSSFISKSINSQLPTRPTPRSLRKLTNPDSKPQANVKISDLFEACGYQSQKGDTYEEDRLLSVDTGDAERRTTSPFEAISHYFDNKPSTLAMAMLSNALVAAGIGPQLDIKLHNTYFEIADGSSGFSAIGIQALCQDDTGARAMQLVIKARLCDALCDERAGLPAKDRIFYIVTDHKDIFRYCAERLNIPARGTVVLLTEDYEHFCEEHTSTANPKDREQLPELVTERTGAEY